MSFKAYASTEAAQVNSAAFSFSEIIDFLPNLTPIILLISVVVAIIAIKSNKATVRKRATLEFLDKADSNEYYSAAYNAFSELRLSPKGFEPIKNPSDDTSKRARRDVINTLNHYELIAIGIEKGILDEDLYKSFMRTTFVRDWKASRDFIDHIRHKSQKDGSGILYPTAFEKFEKYANKWDH